MPLNSNRVKTYKSSLENIIKEMKIDSIEDIRITILNKCRELKNKSDIKKFNGIDFIVCDSNDFYKPFVNLGYENAALIIIDEYSSEKYFLMFKDKVPEKFYEIIAKHETSEYENISNGIKHSDAHIKASKDEINKAKKVGLYDDYILFLEKNYPMKFEEIKNIKF